MLSKGGVASAVGGGTRPRHIMGVRGVWGELIGGLRLVATVVTWVVAANKPLD